MKTSFKIEEVHKMARLSSLALTEKEAKVFAKQFAVILDYFELLKTAEIPEIETDSDESYLVSGREDKVMKSKVSPEQFSPYLEDGFFKVPRVIDHGK